MKNIVRVLLVVAAGAVLLFSSLAIAKEKEKADRKSNPNTAKLLAIGAWQGRLTYGADYDGPMTPASPDLYVKATRTVTGTGKLTHPANLGAPGATKKAFLRTDPRKKDLFFRDQDGLVRKHYAGLNPSKCELHIVDDTMVSFSTLTDAEHRRVNMNSTPANSNARQYAVDVVSRPWPKAHTDYGEAMTHAQGPYAAFREPLKNHYVVEIYPTMLETTVRHEIGHAIGIRHHCGKNEAWSLVILVGEPPNVTEKTSNGTSSDDCFGQIDVKSDP